jgi:hypothetical protein
MTSDRPQLTLLARPFPREFIEDKDGQSYVAHDVVTQRLLYVLGPFSWQLVEVYRGDVPAVPPDPKGRSKRAKDGVPELRNAIVGGVWRLTVTVDGERVAIEEVGEVEDPHNWSNDGIRLKQSSSDAIKRCAMRAGLGLHLWSQQRYELYGWLRRDQQDTKGSGDGAGQRDQMDREPAAS